MSADRATGPSTWLFGPPESAVVVHNAEALMADLAVHLGGWPIRWAGETPPGAPDITVAAGGAPGGWRLAAPAIGVAGRDFDDGRRAAAAFAELLARTLAAHSGRTLAAAAAVETAAGLVLLVGPKRAGKTLLALQMAAIGQRLFADDWLAVRAGGTAPPSGFCLGLTPRLALPLPADAGPALAEFVDGYLEIREGDTGWLKLWSGEAAGFGDEAAIAAVVRLAREGGASRLEAGASDDPAFPGVPAFTLRYGESLEAARALYRHFTLGR